MMTAAQPVYNHPRVTNQQERVETAGYRDTHHVLLAMYERESW